MSGLRTKTASSSSLLLEDLQKSNEELRQKLSDSLLKDSSLESSSILIQRLCDKESEELRRTVSRLERLLEIEREERNSNDEKALELLTDVKKQWQEREEIRIQKMRSEVESAQKTAQELQRRNSRLTHDLDRISQDLESALEVKSGLKAKCLQFKKNFESLRVNYKEKSTKIMELEEELRLLSDEKETALCGEKNAQEEVHRRRSIFDFEKDQLKLEMVEKENGIQALRTELLSIQVRMEEILEQKKTLDQEKSQFLWDKEELSREEAEIKERLSKMESDIEEERKFIEENKLYVEREKKSAQELQLSIEKERAEITAQSKKMNEEQDRFNKEKTSMIKLKTEVENLKANLMKECQDSELKREEEKSSLLAQFNGRILKERCEFDESLSSLRKENDELKSKLSEISAEESKRRNDESKKLKEELSLLKIDFRVAEKQNKDNKDTISYLRQMYREERDSFRSLDGKKAELESEVEKLKMHVERLEKDANQAQTFKECNGKLKEDLVEFTSQIKTLKLHIAKSNSDIERLTSHLEKAEKEVIKYRDSQTQLNIYKVACLELEDQAKEYETIIDKLEKQRNNVSSQLKEVKDNVQSAESNSTELKIQINDMKSKLIFTNSQLSEARSKNEELETLYKSEEHNLKSRVKELTCSKEKHMSTINDFKIQMEELSDKYTALSKEENSKKIALNDLKESYSDLLTKYYGLNDRCTELSDENEGLRIKLTGLEDFMGREKLSKEQMDKNHKKVKHELNTKINQLEKLVDYLQTKINKRVKCKGIFCNQKFSDQGNVNVALPYEALKDKLKDEENRNRQLLKDLINAKGELRSSRTKDPATILLPTPMDQRANHSIPHRWVNQTNMKVTKCSTCFGDVHFCRQASVCQYCHRTVHVHCVENAPNDCGLPKTLAPVLKNSSKKEKPFEGYLKIPEQGGKYWNSVHVKIVDDKLVIRGEGKETMEIDLMPSNGFVYIQSSVVYTELLHTTAYDQPHVFKIGYSSCKDTHYFMAKSFSDKAMWIKEIENISLRIKDDDTSEASSTGDDTNMHNIFQKEIASLNSTANIYCVVPMRNTWLLGTSEGLLLVNSGIVSQVEVSTSAVYQMEIIPSINKILLITGHDRKLGILSMEQINSRDFNPTNIDSVKSCHLFGVGIISDVVYLCVVDDCRVSIFRYDSEKFRMVHKFSTENPTSCLRFTSSSVLVITDKIYDIDLEDFAVEEFLDLDESPMTLSNNYPIAMFQINSSEFILCFQDCGVVVNWSGSKSRSDIKWNSISGQFAYSCGKLWVAYYNAVEVFDLNADGRPSEMMLSKNPQILSCHEHVYLLDDRSNGLTIMELTNSGS